ncbi:hypothetical protein [Novosphingobium ginsenosidimutans]|uniref:hypothetical protein n=1 Tax=Novosphingobium ginsenosidimutans TaxID=1176536 RepID=UPI00137629AE|nr:hypothetical protein [Novosphingobium ginsenosidimutans]
MRAILLLACMSLVACQREPSFDERYAKTQKTLEQKAAAIDRQAASPTPAPNPSGE